MKSLRLPDIYRSTNLNTLAIWKKNAGIGEIREDSYYDPVKLALATGIKPAMPSPVSRLVNELNAVISNDPLAERCASHYAKRFWRLAGKRSY